MSSKTNTVLLVILIILVLGFGGWMVYSQGKMQNSDQLSEPVVIDHLKADEQDPVVPTISNDASLKAMTTVQLHKIAKDNNLAFVPDYPITFSKLVDLTGDGVNEGVFSGNGGNNGASFILKMNDNGTTTLLKQKNKDGSISPVYLVELGRVMVSEQFQLLPAERGYYTVSKSMNAYANPPEEEFACTEIGLNAYKWNTSTQVFEWNQALTTKYAAQVCI